MDPSRSWKPTEDKRSRGCNSLWANRHWVSIRVGVLEQACLIEPEAAPPPAHPFPIRIEVHDAVRRKENRARSSVG